jgi:hypothetical protein
VNRRETAGILALHQPGGHTKALGVDDVLHCGACHPLPYPVDLPELDGSLSNGAYIAP